MIRSFLWVGAICLLVADADAALYTFESPDAPAENGIRVLTPGGEFEVEDKADKTGYRYLAVSPFHIEVFDGGNPVRLAMEYVAVQNDQISIRFQGRAEEQSLELVCENTGTTIGDPVPMEFSGRAAWKDLSGAALSAADANAPPRFSTITIKTIPAASPLAFGAVAIGLLGLGRIVRRQFGRPRLSW